ncbi:MAG: hypothetical protein WC314_15820 [Vulcanimicrobiota bacterium]
MRSQSSKGLIIPTAMFVAMFALLLVNCIMASVSHNFDMHLRSVESTEFRYVSFGTANQLLSNLNGSIALSPEFETPPVRNEELTYETFSKNDPWEINDQGRITETWIEPQDEQGKVILVVSRTYRGGPSTAQEVKLLARFKARTVGRIYTNSPDDDPNSPDPIYYSDAATGAWEELPPVPRMRYKSDGTLEYKQGELASSLPYISGSPDGTLYSGYVPAMDGWGDPPVPIFFLPIQQGALCLKTVIRGAESGKTMGDLQPILQVLIDVVPSVTLSKGAVPLKFDHDSGQWQTMPPPEQVRMVNGKFEVEAGNYNFSGVPGPPVGFNGGAVSAMYRKGQDALYVYQKEANGYEILTPPGQDVMVLAADESGAMYVQTGELKPVFIDYLLNILVGNLDRIYANTDTSAIHKYEDGEWTTLPNPPAKFYNKQGELVEDPYSGSRGPQLGGMVGGNKGEVTLINRPGRGTGLVDTVYRYKEGFWEVLPSPPNTYYDSAGNEVTSSELPSTLELGTSAKGKMMLRVLDGDGHDAIFEETDAGKDYTILAPVQDRDGQYVENLFLTTGGEKRDGSNKGSFTVTGTYL